MISPYALPPGYIYEATVDCQKRAWMSIVDRAGDHVISVELEDTVSSFTALWSVIKDDPSVLEHHAPAFLVWRLTASPLDEIAELEL